MKMPEKTSKKLVQRTAGGTSAMVASVSHMIPYGMEYKKRIKISTRTKSDHYTCFHKKLPR